MLTRCQFSLYLFIASHLVIITFLTKFYNICIQKLFWNKTSTSLVNFARSLMVFAYLTQPFRILGAEQTRTATDVNSSVFTTKKKRKTGTARKMASKLFPYLVCVVLVLVPFLAKSDAFGTGSTSACPKGAKWCHGKKKFLMVSQLNNLTSNFSCKLWPQDSETAGRRL